MKIKDGGQLEQFGKSGQKLCEIRINKAFTGRSFELLLVSNDKENGLPDESLSYLSIEELLNLRDQINNALKDL